MKAAGNKVGSVFIDVTAKTDQFRQGMATIDADAKRRSASIKSVLAQNEAQAKSFGDTMRTSMSRSNIEAGKLQGSILGLKNVLVGVGSILAMKSFNEVADKFSLMRSRIRLVTKEGENLYQIEEALARQAFANRASLQETVTLYTRLRQSREDLSDAVTQNLVDKWSKTLIISASSTAEATSSTLQFAQAMSAGVLAGQELRSVIQGNSAFAVSLAKGLGVTTGQLKQMGEEGKLTTDVIIAAINKAGDSIEHDFSKKALTVGQAMTNVETATLRVLGSIDQAFGISSANAEWLNSMAAALNDLTIAMQGPVKEAEVAIDKLNAANASIRADTESLAGLHDKLNEAIRAGGDAATIAARQEIDAVNQRIAKNKELSQVYMAQARAKLAEADAEMQNMLGGRRTGFEVSELAMKLAEVPLNDRGDTPFSQFGYRAYRADAQGEIDRRLGNPLKRFDAAMAQIGRAQDAGKPLTAAQNEILKFAATVADIRIRLDAARNAVEALKDGGTIAPVAETPAAAKPGKLEAVTLKQLELERARAEGKRELVAQLEDEIRILQLTATLQEKGLNAEQARARATEHVKALRVAANALSEKELQYAQEEASLRYQIAMAEARGDKERVADLETQLEINRRALELEEQGLAADQARAQAIEQVTALREALNATSEKDLAMARELRDLEYQMALASAAGDQARVRSLQQELDIRREMNDLIQLGYDADEARTIAEQRINALAQAKGAWAEFERSLGDATKRGLLHGVETGDWGDAFGQMLADVTRDALSRALDVLWEALAQIDWGGFGSGAGGFLNMMGSAFTSGPIKSRAGGGPVNAGDMVRVGELGSEWFRPKVDGFILPHDFGGKSMSAIVPVNVGGAQIVIQGNADAQTVAMMDQRLAAWSRGLPAAIDARVTDRLKRGAY